MKRLGLVLGLTSALLFVGMVTAAGAPRGTAGSSRTLTLSVTGFADIFSSRVRQVCGQHTGETLGWQQNKGVAKGQGSLMSGVDLPTGATITRFSYSFVDNTPFDTYGFLERRRVTPGSATGAGAFSVLASVKSVGAAPGVQRLNDSSIAQPVVDAESYAYIAEVVACIEDGDPFPPNPRPIAVQIRYNEP